MTNNATILLIVSLVSFTIIIITVLLVHLSKVVINKDIELKNSVEVTLTEGRIKSTFDFGCKTVRKNPEAQLETPKNKRKKRMIKRSAPSYHHTQIHN